MEDLIVVDEPELVSSSGELARSPETIRLLAGKAEAYLTELNQPDWRLLGVNERGFEVAVDEPTGKRRSFFLHWPDFGRDKTWNS